MRKRKRNGKKQRKKGKKRTKGKKRKRKKEEAWAARFDPRTPISPTES